MSESESIITLSEWGERFLPGVQLSEKERRLADTLDGVDLREMRDGVYIKASSWVGVVNFESFTLQINPKLSNIDIVRLLLVTGGLDRLEGYRANRKYLFEDSISLFDLIALLLVDACTLIARDGLLRGYIVEEDDLPTMRGRLRVVDQVRRRYGQINRLECVYDDHHADVIDNQILHTALMLCRRYTKHPLIRNRVQALEDIFKVACGPIKGNWRDIRSQMTYNRLNSRYRESHQLAWLVLDGLGVHELMATGSISGFAFLLDMNSLFEDFVTVLIRKILSKDEIIVQSQAKSGGHIWDVGRDRSYTHIIPDLLAKKPSGERLAIDAKYKRYDEHKLAQDDIYQLFLYAYAFRDPGGKLPSALLLFPSDGRAKQPTRLQLRDSQGYTQARLHAIGIDVPLMLDTLMGIQDKGAFAYLRGIVHQLLE